MHIRPRLRIPQVLLKRLVEFGLAEGRPSLKVFQMANTVGGDEDFATDLEVVTVNALIGEYKCPKPKHGGGGWQRLISEAPEFIDFALEERKKGIHECKLVFPQYFPEKLSGESALTLSELDQNEIDNWIVTLP